MFKMADQDGVLQQFGKIAVSKRWQSN